jgi:hypothetical protein
MNNWRPIIKVAIKVALILIDAACAARPKKKPKQ